jgi:shikimate kinase
MEDDLQYSIKDGGKITLKLLFLIGDAAVGKMTVGQEIMKLTGLRLFHNHMTIEPVIEIFGYYESKTISKLREVIFEEFTKSNNEGLIFTYMWAFDQQSDWDYIQHVTDMFEEQGADVYYVELVAPQEIRLERNQTENRLKNKASKRNLAFSEQNLLNSDEKYRMESFENEIPYKNYIKIYNNDLEPEIVAKMIQDRFSL